MTISLPQGDIRYPIQAGGGERRANRRYHVELPLRVTWRDPEGNACEANGLAMSISRSGIFFVVPTAIHTSEPLQLELILPDEITQRGEMRIKLAARTLRQETVGDGLREETRGFAVAAALVITDADQPFPLVSHAG